MRQKESEEAMMRRWGTEIGGLTLVQTVEEESKELLRVVLLVAVERRRKLDDGFLEKQQTRTKSESRRAR